MAGPSVEHDFRDDDTGARRDPLLGRRRLVDVRCGFAERARLQAEAAEARLQDVKARYETALAALVQAESVIEPDALAAAKEAAHRAFRKSDRTAESRADVEKAAGAWLAQINRINVAARANRRRIERQRDHVDVLEVELAREERSATAARATAEMAMEACVEARKALSEGEAAAAEAARADATWRATLAAARAIAPEREAEREAEKAALAPAGRDAETVARPRLAERVTPEPVAADVVAPPLPVVPAPKVLPAPAVAALAPVVPEPVVAAPAPVVPEPVATPPTAAPPQPAGTRIPATPPPPAASTVTAASLAKTPVVPPAPAAHTPPSRRFPQKVDPMQARLESVAAEVTRSVAHGREVAEAFEAQKAAAERAVAERQATERAAAERQAAERQAAERQAAERVAAEEREAAARAAADRLAADNREAAERVAAAEREAAERIAADKRVAAQGRLAPPAAEQAAAEPHVESAEAARAEVAPSKPAQPVEPVEPVEPVKPVEPAETVRPVEPAPALPASQTWAGAIAPEDAHEPEPLVLGETPPPAVMRLIARDSATLGRLVAALAGPNAAHASRYKLLLCDFADGLVAAAIDAGYFIFPETDPFWSMFTNEQGRDIARGLAALGCRYDGMQGFADGRVPTHRDLSLATGHAGINPVRIRRWPERDEAAGLFRLIQVATDELLVDRAPTLTLGELVRLLGRRADSLVDLWNDWDRVRPLLLARS